MQEEYDMSQTEISAQQTAGYAGMLVGSNHDIDSGIQAETSAEMPFGVCVVFGSTEQAVKLPSAITDNAKGIVAHSHAYDKDLELGSTGLKIKTQVNVLRRGQIMVTVEEAVAPGDRAYVRYAGSGQAGAFRKTAVVGETLDVTLECQFKTVTAANGVAIVDCDFTNS